jgi:DNA-binding CsgD family transcriptional regulator
VNLAALCGAVALGDTARKLLVQAGGRIRILARTPLDSLTGSERRVTTMAAAGHSNRHIAEALFITLRTVETHLTSAYRKLGIAGRADLKALFAGSRETPRVSARGFS